MCPAVNDIPESIFSSKEGFEQVKIMFTKLWTGKEQYRKMIFGQKSERFIPNPAEQLQFDSFEEQDEEFESVEVAAYTKSKTKKKHPGRNQLPSHLERKLLIIEPDEVKNNKEDYEKIGEEITEQLEMKPAKFWVKRTVRPKYKKVNDGSFLCAPLPPHLFPKSIAGYSVISDILTSKYTDHLPLYRIIKRYKRSRLIIPESTMIGWISSSCTYLKLLYIRMQLKMNEAKLIQGDESPIPVLERGNPKTHRGYMFIYIIDKKYVLYDYRAGRGRDGPVQFLKDFHGIFQSDGYEGYNKIVLKNGLIHIGCMAQVRRKFFEAVEKGEKISEKAISYIRDLYDIEREYKDSAKSELLKIRQSRSKPVFKNLLEWAEKTKKIVLPQSPTGKAIGYLLNQKIKLEKYIEYSEADIDNNLCERTIRPMTIGRKNFMFAGSEEGANRAAIIYSIVLTCRMYDIDPYKYFIKVFEIMAVNPEIDLDLLLPDRISL